MDDLIKRIRIITEKAASREEILPFLNVYVKNTHLSLLNLLLEDFQSISLKKEIRDIFNNVLSTCFQYQKMD